MESAFDRLSALVRRELGASDVRLLDRGENPPEAPNVAHHKLDDARTVLVTFESAPTDLDALRRRLAMLVDTFAESLADPAGERFRAAHKPVSSSLYEELRALAMRADALDVLVIDADSPIVWGSARRGVLPSRPPVPLAAVSHPRLVSQDDGSAPELAKPGGSSSDVANGSNADLAKPAGSAPQITSIEISTPELAKTGPVLVEESLPLDDDRVIEHAITAIRKVAEAEQIHKGRSLRHVHIDDVEGRAHLALSFSGIYLLLLVYRGTFDELRAERAAQEALPRIERLVLALPPLDPEPQPVGQVISMRRRR